MRGEQAIFNLEIKKKSGLSINSDIHHSKVFSSYLITNFKFIIYKIVAVQKLYSTVKTKL